MSIELYLYLFTLLLASIAAALFIFALKRSFKKIPETWKKFQRCHFFCYGICFLMIHLTITWICESINCYFAINGIINHFISTICFTLSLPFLFGFFFINTTSKWKKISYCILYLLLVLHFIKEGYYHPKCIVPVSSILFTCSTHFLAALLYLTDLLVYPKTFFFKLQIQIGSTILIRELLAAILGSYFYSGMFENKDLFFRLQFYNMVLSYFLLIPFFLSGIVKLKKQSIV